MIFIEWIYRKVVSPLKEIKSVDEIKQNYENKNEISYVYFGNIERELNIMKNKTKKILIIFMVMLKMKK